MIMDTGAATSAIDAAWFEENKENLPPLQICPFKVVTADGSKTSVAGFIPEIRMEVNGQILVSGLLILKNRKPGAGLLGLDALEKINTLFDIKKRMYIKKKSGRTTEETEKVRICNLVKEKFVVKEKSRKIDSKEISQEGSKTNELKKRKQDCKLMQLFAIQAIEIPPLGKGTVWTTARAQGMDDSKVWVTEMDGTTPPPPVNRQVSS